MPPADYLIIESTYGGRLHEAEGSVKDKLAAMINATARRGGKIIMTAFAVGRVQQLVVLLHQLSNDGRVPNISIFVDSPLAMNVTKVFRHHPECFDEETRKYLTDGDDPFGFRRLQYIREAGESKKLNLCTALVSSFRPRVCARPAASCIICATTSKTGATRSSSPDFRQRTRWDANWPTTGPRSEFLANRSGCAGGQFTGLERPWGPERTVGLDGAHDHTAQENLPGARRA